MPDEFSITVTKGIISAYPNAIFMFDIESLDHFVNDIKHLSSQKDFTQVMSKYAVRRTDPSFWSKSDLIHEKKYKSFISDEGLLDYGRLINQ